jgi:hypothetical protein
VEPTLTDQTPWLTVSFSPTCGLAGLMDGGWIGVSTPFATWSVGALVALTGPDPRSAVTCTVSTLLTWPEVTVKVFAVAFEMAVPPLNHW